jgi:excisionase family DNA binding protein
VPDSRSRSEDVVPDRLPLGKASRMLGVDPDTLRRWADEGRVPAFTTPGGHRRFERRALERLVVTRQTGALGGLAAVGDSSTRLSAAYRRRYGELHRGSQDLRSRIPVDERTSFREDGRRLVDALVSTLDEAGSARTRAEQEAMDLSARMGDRIARLGVPLEDGVSMFVEARRPFFAELSLMARRRGVDPARIGQLYVASSGLLDRLLLAFVGAHAAAADEGPEAPAPAAPAEPTARPKPVADPV